MFTWLYLLKNKVEYPVVFKRFKAMVESQFDFPTKSLETIWQGEFKPLIALFNA
jgi:hypothetical protein